MSAGVVSIDDLMTPSQFFKETGIHGTDFYPLYHAGRVEGTITVYGRLLLFRSQINIHYQKNGYKFGLWKELGGRHVSVSVPDFIRIRNKQAKGIEASKLL